ncbi:hypothetical protein Poli38472_000094 [Pythium oligandrum]|uniref:Amine oxidase domain-containing protein n=1 Tax=Pythium oligandrum TaxID=41045 RepID=A0A8K1CBB9_PYTOL|nr:hypothetical protein Poli38472_000094 [Pythium oligandrum]|eukprot:TMW60052.1 hypothetical protein Poli38472_000094 [Pythium oligandrum]
MARVLVVGAGVTGAALARLLHDAKTSTKYAGQVLVWEKSNITGGRMMARSFRKNRHVHVDFGAQYLTKFKSANDDIRELLVANGKLVNFEDSRIAQESSRAPSPDAEHTVSPDNLGFRSMVDFLLSDATVQVERGVERFDITSDGQVTVYSTDGHVETVDDLVLTCPIPNVLSILEKSHFQPAPEVLAALQAVQYSQRFAVAYLFDQSIAKSVQDLQWTSKYVGAEEDEVVRFLCWDTLKKGTSTQDGYALLVHTGVPFGLQHMDAKDKNDEILATITRSVQKLLPFLPDPVDTTLHRWRVSQTFKPFHDPASPSSSVPALVLHASPRIILAGDAFLGSGFDNCLLSAKHTASILLGPSSGL